ncbi:MAG: phasin family protein [bacterium]
MIVVTSGFRKAFLLGLGTVSVTKEKTEQLIEDMAKKGKISREEAREYFDVLVEKGQEEREHIQNIVQSEMARFKDMTKFVSREEYDRLSKRVKELEMKLNAEQNAEEDSDSSE